jgi:hypothetical protein
MPINLTIKLNNKPRTFNYISILMIFGVAQYVCMLILDASQIGVVMFRMPNITSVTLDLYDNIPHEDCRCAAMPTEHCLFNIQLKIIRILPIILFVSEVCFIREHFILTGDWRYLILNIYWIVCIFVLLSILIIIYRNQYYYDWVGIVLYGINLLLMLYFFPRVRPRHRNRRYSTGMFNA